MIVSCPACESRFEVDQEQLGHDGRIVRCGKCGNCWHQMPDNDPRAAVAAAPPPPPARRAAQPPKKKKSRAALVGWILLLFFIGGLVAGGWFERQRIVAQFPQLADVYALLGVPVDPPGPVLKLSDVALDRDVVEGDTVIIVRGVVSNISDRKQEVPSLRAQLTNGSGEILAEWTFEVPQAELDAGGSVAFETETKNPPEGARDLNISLVEPEH
ncbi:MAG: zinc-ribbon domain-containing protein [Kiloniellaceae bacterium]